MDVEKILRALNNAIEVIKQEDKDSIDVVPELEDVVAYYEQIKMLGY